MMQLGRRFQEIAPASRGVEAITIFESWEPHLIITDGKIPVMDSGEATRRIKSTELGADTPIHAVTVGAFGEDRTRLLDSGPQGFVRKPFKQGELLEAVQELLGVTCRHADDTEQRPDGIDAVPGALPTDALGALPADWKAAMEKADLDTTRLDELIDEIKSGHGRVAVGLRSLVEEFEFEALGKLL